MNISETEVEGWVGERGREGGGGGGGGAGREEPVVL